MSDLAGIPLFPSRFVPEGQIMRTPMGIHYHERVSVRGRRHRPHGRGRPCPRRWKVQVVTYHPDLDRLLEAARDDS